MEKHEKIFVPSEIFTNLVVIERTPISPKKRTYVQRSDNVIVLSVKELKAIFRTVWEEAQLSIDKDNGFDIPGEEYDGPVAKNAEECFTAYLQSNGISL